VRPVLTPILGLLLFQQQDVSLLLEHATPPSRPVSTLATGLSVVEVEVDGRTRSMQTRQLYGNSPFVTPALNALMSWGFAVPPGVSSARTSITFLFRSPAIYPVPIPPPAVKRWAGSPDTSALPQEIVDPGYPPAAVAEGTVVLLAKINADGIVIGVEKFSGDAALFDQSQIALKKWKFSPARIANKPVSSSAYVVISFIRPT
jgi:Gram-negative bacterial TonB protein C-terminal